MFYIFTEQVNTGLVRIMHPVLRISGNITDTRMHPLRSKIYGSYFFQRKSKKARDFQWCSCFICLEISTNVIVLPEGNPAGLKYSEEQYIVFFYLYFTLCTMFVEFVKCECMVMVQQHSPIYHKSVMHMAYPEHTF